MLDQLIVDIVKSMNQPKMNVQKVYTVNSRADKCKQSAFFDTRLKLSTNVP